MTTIEDIKKTVSSYKVVPFSAKDISCRLATNKQPVIYIKDQFYSDDTKVVMNSLGIRNNLSERVFKKPEENWQALKSAIAAIDSYSQFGCIVDEHDRFCSLTKGAIKEERELNYDARIDQIFNTIDDSKIHTFQDITFDPETASVLVNSIFNDEIDVGGSDLWRAGTTTRIGFNNQQFQQYFLRLVCTNGMTTRENVSYRTHDEKGNIGKQFLKYSTQTEFANSIKPRVARLRDSRASVYEVEQVASLLKKDDRNTFMPHYNEMINDFAERGYKISGIPTKKQRFMYTNENMYDLFNVATYLASHARDTIGDSAALSLNKVAGEFFTNGPVLGFNLVDIYDN